MLATFLVTSSLDDFSSGTLREAVDDANNLFGPDEIIFSTVHNLDGATIILKEGALSITDGVMITTLDATGDPLFPNGITIGAKGNDLFPTVDDGGGSSVFDIQITAGLKETKDVILAGLTITGGDTAFYGGGVAFHVSTVDLSGSSTLTIDKSVIEGNHAVLNSAVFSQPTSCHLDWRT